MKIKENYILRQVADSSVVVPVGAATIDFNGMINLNETGAFLFKILQNGASKEDMVKALLEEYRVDAVTAAQDAEHFINKLKDAGIIE